MASHYYPRKSLLHASCPSKFHQTDHDIFTAPPGAAQGSPGSCEARS